MKLLNNNFVKEMLAKFLKLSKSPEKKERKSVNIWPEQYMQNPNMDKPIEKIWDDIDNYSFEDRYEAAKELRSSWSVIVPIPPVLYKGKFVKGVLFSQATKIIMEKFPELQNLFFICANSMFTSYPRNHKADYFFTCYKNKKREAYYKNKYPETKNIICLPLQDADFLNEYYIAPVPNVEKTIDVFCVSTPFPVKNLPVIAKALLEYEKKYGRVLKVVYAIGKRSAIKREDGSLDYSQVEDYGKNELIKVDEILGDTKKYIDFYPFIEYKDLSRFYSSSKCAVLGSLIEGKNRFISEALSCDTPIIVFKDFNKYTRGDFPVFFGNSGEYVPEFTPESLADTIHKVITNPQNYEPRKNYLEHYGRKNFVNIMADANPYYAQNIPGYEKGRFFENVWYDMACWDNYQVSYHDFLYGKKVPWQHVAGVKDIEALIKLYYNFFGLEWKYEGSAFDD